MATATIATSALTGGVHSLTATYNGGAAFSASTTLTPLSQTVKPIASSTALTTAPNPSASGQGVLLTATVTTGATGTVSFYNNVSTLIATQPLNGGSPNTATFTVSSLLPTPNPNSITAVYNGDLNYLTGTSNAVNQTVTPSLTSTSLGVTVSGKPSSSSPLGQTVTLTATVSLQSNSSAVTSGSVTFFSGADPIGSGVLNGSGKATLNTSLLSAGPNSLMAFYVGVSGMISPSVSSASAFTVNSVKQNGFAAPSSFGTGIGNAPYWVAVADFNGDGSADLAIGLVGQPYSQTLDAAGGAPAYMWSKSGGQLPAGLSLSTGARSRACRLHPELTRLASRCRIHRALRLWAR